MKVDVLVIGAGPAGAASAMACRRRGLDVALVEAQPFPRPRPGESLPPAVEPLLEHMGAGSVLGESDWLRYSGIWTAWDGPLRFNSLGSDGRGQWRGWQAPRAQFDARLLEQAETIGVQLLQPCRACAVACQGGRVVGLETTRGSVTCKYLVDASGGRHWLARRLRLRIAKQSPKLIARFGYGAPEADRAHSDPTLTADARGWTWIAPIEADRLAWVRLRYDGRPVERDWRPAGLRRSEADRSARGAADVSWRCVEPSSGPGYYCVGDAAVVMDPLSSHGTLRALMSGSMAGSAIASSLRSSDSAEETRRCNGYDRWMRAWFEHDCDELRALYRLLPNPPNWV